MKMIDWSKIKVVILDRDGVINHDSDAYIKSAEEWIPISGSLQAIADLNKNFKVAIATNQSGIGRGYYDEEVLQQMHQKMSAMLSYKGGKIDLIEFCPHHPDDGCECRKPKTLMLENIAAYFDVDPREILFVGDSKSDYECAQSFDCNFALLLTGKGLKTLEKLAGKNILVEKSLAKLVEAIDR